MPIGEPQTITFQGQATHGGGSCQISLTTDTPPTKNSVFKVIKSIEGGCPSTNPGNVGTDPFGYGADSFNFSIPSSIPAGKNYTMAWTWFNKIGNREMYMNCAPITVPSSSQRRSVDEVDTPILTERDSMSSLPDMFRANIGSVGNGCSSPVSGSVLAIPQENLGSNVQRIGNEPLVPPVGGNCGGTYGAAAVNSTPADSQSGQSGTSGQSSTAAPADPQSSEPASPAPADPQSSQSASPAAADPQSVQSAAPVQPSTATIPAPQPTLTSSVAPPYSNSTSAPASPSAAAPDSVPGLTTGTCPTPGKSVCSPDGTAWGTCDENHKVIYQKVAEGTKCDPSIGTEIHVKRSRFFRY